MSSFHFSERVRALGGAAERDCREAGLFSRADEVCSERSEQVLAAFRCERVSSGDFAEVTGYGYSDGGREKLERIYAAIFGAQDALVRLSFLSGTHALTVALRALLRPGDTLLAISGAPYDTLQAVIGTSGGSGASLLARGVRYEQIELSGDSFDLPTIFARVARGDVRVAHIQRSRGYSARGGLCIDKIARAIAAVKDACPETIVLVDNCYGEFVERREPTMVGADVAVGSLLKNPGGGMASTGGYCAGRADLIAEIAEWLTAPSIGRDLGANFGQLSSLYKGIFLAPSVVAAALKTAIFAARALSLAGFRGVSPRFDEPRTDIVQTVDLGSADALVAFCGGLQSGSPIDSFARPEPGEMPGYEDLEVMAGGSFIGGSTIELSADGPLKPPYTAYLQGGLTFDYGKLGVLSAIEAMQEKGYISL